MRPAAPQLGLESGLHRLQERALGEVISPRSPHPYDEDKSTPTRKLIVREKYMQGTYFNEVWVIISYEEESKRGHLAVHT